MSKPISVSCLAVAMLSAAALGNTVFAAQIAPNLITSAIDEGHVVAVVRSTHPSARSEFDQGAAPDNLPMERMLLVLKFSPERQSALDQFLEELQRPSSPNYHKWLTPEQFGEQFGASDSDIQIVMAWLQNHGFTIAPVPAGRGVIEFSGNAGQVRSAFQTEIHKYAANGREHWANAGDQKIPASLANAVAGVASLHNFVSAAQSRVVDRPVPFSDPLYTSSSGGHYLSPGDFATIYNVAPLYPSITGAGTTIAVVGRSNINIQDVITFRSLMGLPANPPNIIVNGTNPGDLGGGEELEAVLDTSWAGAAATGATVDLVVSASTNTTDGVDLSELYIINHNLANVMTESFGSCENSYSSAQATLVSNNAQQAAALGITYTVSSGDSGSAGCDDPNTMTTSSGTLSVNLLASTPYTVAVGGTQFNEASSQYWSATNGSNRSSALSYIPEDVWNANCTGSTCGTGSILAGGGGPSIYFTKPSWQTGVAGIPADGVRDIPDVSLSAAGHDPYMLCVAGSCSASTPSFYAVYGTSASAPSFASIVALINQKTGSRLGQMTPRLYALAASETLSGCNASNTSGLPGANCIFNDVTVGTNAVPGEANYNTANETYLAKTGYDLATGLGSVNVTNLVNNWSATVTSPTAAVSPASLSFASQTTGTTSAALTVTLSNSGTAALSVTSIAISGTNVTSFAQTNSCASTLAAGASCSIYVTFTPGATGILNASLVVTDNSGNLSGSTQSVALTGTGTSSTGPTPTTFTTYLGTYGGANPAFSGASALLPLRVYNPAGTSQIYYLFADVNAGSSIEYQIFALSDGAGGFNLRLQNSSSVSSSIPLSATGGTVTLTTPLTLGTVSINAYRYALVGNEFQLDVSITRSGTFNDQIALLSVSTTGAYSSPWNVSDGQWSSTASGSPGVTLSPTSLTFAIQTVGVTSSLTVTVTNSGSAALNITSANVSGTNASDFIATNNCPSSVAAAASCTINVAFDPLATGARTATLSITDNATGSPQAVALSGTGSTSTGPTPSTFTTYLGTYGNANPTYSGASAVLPLRVYNPAGTSQIYYLFADFNASSSIEYQVFALSDGAGGFNMRLQNSSAVSSFIPLSATGGTVTLTTPLTLGTVSITAYRYALVGNEFQLDVSMTRTGTFTDQIALLSVSTTGAYSSPWNVSDGQWTSSGSTGPAVTLSTTNLAFGTQTVGVTANQTVTVTNSGGSALNISSATVSGTNAGDFIATDNCPASVAAGNSCTIGIAFDPLAVGARTASLSIVDNATGSPQTVSLSGTGSSSTGPTPTTFTTYLGTYGSANPTFNGASAVLPLRAYNPNGTSQISYLFADFNAGSNVEYQVLVLSDGAGGFTMRLQNASSVSATIPLSATGGAVTLTTPLTLGTVSLTAYRYALVGNEFQLDTSITRTGTFSDQIALLSVSTTGGYSSPWNLSDGQWSNP